MKMGDIDNVATAEIAKEKLRADTAETKLAHVESEFEQAVHEGNHEIAAKDAEIERLRKQRDKLADRIYEMEFKSHPDASFAHAHECASRALAFAGLRVVDGNIEETSES